MGWYHQDDVDTYTMRLKGVFMRTPEEVARYTADNERAANALLEGRGGARWWCFIDIEGMVLGPDAVEPFSAYVRTALERFYLGVVRYGIPADKQGSVDTIRATARRGRFPSHVFTSRDEAELAMATLRKHPPRPVEG